MAIRMLPVLLPVPMLWLADAITHLRRGVLILCDCVSFRAAVGVPVPSAMVASMRPTCCTRMLLRGAMVQ